MKEKERVCVTTVVAVEPALAFSIFTEEIGTWWKPRIRNLFRKDRTGVMKFEPGPGGRLLEFYPDAPDDPFEIGRVLTWIAGERLVFEWRQAGFGPGEVTQVDIRFEAVGNGTRITLEHSGWDSIPACHPSRHGATGGAFVALMGIRWGDQLTFFRAHATSVYKATTIQGEKS